MLRVNSCLDIIDEKLYKEGVNMNNPVIEGGLGILIYFASRYHTTRNPKFKRISLELFERVISFFPNYEFSQGYIEGFEGVFWSVSYLKKCSIIEDDSILSDIQDYYRQSMEISIKLHDFDLLHGYIGKIQYLIGNYNLKKEETNLFLEKIENSLWNNSIEFNNSIFWYDEEGNNRVNLDFSHGISSILSFLVTIYSKRKISLTKEMIEKISNFFLNLSPIDNTSFYSTGYYFSDDENNFIQSDKQSRLAWCSGDLGIAYSLLYANTILQKSVLESRVKDILKKCYDRNVENSGIIFFNMNSKPFYDIAFCHGIGGVVFSLYRISKLIVEDNSLSNCYSYWKEELLNNLEVYLSIDEDIYYPQNSFSNQNPNEKYTIDKYNFLNGVVGTGLVLQTIESGCDDWAQFLGYY